ncbi:hypothetical protein BN1723_016717, partial [Verticillium longisporum]
SIFAASYYHKVNSQVEAGAKATWNSKTGNNVGLEVASKYRIDPVSFAKVKVNEPSGACPARRPDATASHSATRLPRRLSRPSRKDCPPVSR